MVSVQEEAIVFYGVADEPEVASAYADFAGYSYDWCQGPDLNRHDLNGRGLLSSLHYGTTQDNPPKHKSNALLS